MAGQASGINITAMEGKTKESSALQQVGDNQIKRNNSSGNSEILIPMVELMHRAPEMLQQPELQKYFVPRVVSLGPYHRNGKEFPITEDNKRKVMGLLFPDTNLEDSEEMIIALRDAKALYMADPSSGRIISDDFNDMMILDACFIFHVIDHITRKKWKVPGIRPHHLPLVVDDMFLLENQVPFGVLEAVMKLLGKNPQQMITGFVDTITQESKVPSPLTYLKSFEQITLNNLHCTIRIPMRIVLYVVKLFVKLMTLPILNQKFWTLLRKIRSMYHIWRNGKEIKIEREHEHFVRDEKHFHLLQILRADLLFYKGEEESDLQPFLWRPCRCATELKAAGINLERRWTNSLEDVKFKRGIIFGRLCLPSITHLTKGRLLNLIAYELCSERCRYGITSYVCFLDGLIDRPEDVKELRLKNILPKGLGNDEEVADFFNMVGTNLALGPSCYHKVLKDIETHCHSEWSADFADIRNKYFSNRLAKISFVVATLLFLITIAQGYATFFPVKK